MPSDERTTSPPPAPPLAKRHILKVVEHEGNLWRWDGSVWWRGRPARRAEQEQPSQGKPGDVGEA